MMGEIATQVNCIFPCKITAPSAPHFTWRFNRHKDKILNFENRERKRCLVEALRR